MSSDDLGKRIGDLVAAGQKIEAIKVLREATGLGLAEAKAMVDAAEAGAKAPASSTPPAWAEAVETAQLPPDVRAAAEAGDRIRAIQMLRHQRGLDLMAAKQMLDRAVPVAQVTRRGCLLPLLFGCLVGLSAVAAGVRVP